MTKEELVVYKRMPLWTAETMPPAVQKRHNTKVGTWGRLRILKGKLKFIQLTENDRVLSEHVFEAGEATPFIEPQSWHKVEIVTEDLVCYLEFYCELKDYFVKKYELGAVHSEVLEAVDTISPCKVLDLGCGSGRNALFLSKLGFDVTAVDQNPLSLELLANIVEDEYLDLPLGTYDINCANLIQDYDFILSTVVFMFLDRERIPAIIENMQAHTRSGGYNLIVCAMDTEQTPCHMPFSFTFKEGELKNYYKDWELLKYNENLGHLHRRDENGNRIQLQFATMLAKKVR